MAATPLPAVSATDAEACLVYINAALTARADTALKARLPLTTAAVGEVSSNPAVPWYGRGWPREAAS